jgi:hypothetical protein
MSDSPARSEGKGIRLGTTPKVARLRSAPSNRTQYARGEANPVVSLGGRKSSSELGRGEKKPPAPKWCP